MNCVARQRRMFVRANASRLRRGFFLDVGLGVTPPACLPSQSKGTQPCRPFANSKALCHGRCPILSILQSPSWLFRLGRVVACSSMLPPLRRWAQFEFDLRNGSVRSCRPSLVQSAQSSCTKRPPEDGGLTHRPVALICTTPNGVRRESVNGVLLLPRPCRMRSFGRGNLIETM